MLVGLLATAWAQGAGTLLLSEGDNTIVRGGDTVPAAVDTVVYAEDLLVVGEDGFLVVGLSNQWLVRVEEDLEVQVSELAGFGEPPTTLSTDEQLARLLTPEERDGWDGEERIAGWHARLQSVSRPVGRSRPGMPSKTLGLLSDKKESSFAVAEDDEEVDLEDAFGEEEDGGGFEFAPAPAPPPPAPQAERVAQVDSMSAREPLEQQLQALLRGDLSTCVDTWTHRKRRLKVVVRDGEVVEVKGAAPACVQELVGRQVDGPDATVRLQLRP